MAEDPYVYPGSNGVLINKFDERDGDKLQLAERRLSTQRHSELSSLNLPATAEGYRAVHKHLLQDVYEWAGKDRTINISKPGAPFANAQFVTSQLNKCFEEFSKSTAAVKDPDRFFDRLGEHITELNVIHPFREGNGRAMRAHAEVLARSQGFDIDTVNIDKAKWMAASKVGFVTGDYRDMAQLLREAQKAPEHRLPKSEELPSLPRTDAAALDRTVYMLAREHPALAKQFIDGERDKFKAALDLARGSAVYDRGSDDAKTPTPNAATPRDDLRAIAGEFRNATQEQRLADPRFNAGAKTIAAADAAIDSRYGAGTIEGSRMKDAAREAVAQKFERGEIIDSVRVKAVERGVELLKRDPVRDGVVQQAQREQDFGAAMRDAERSIEDDKER